MEAVTLMLLWLDLSAFAAAPPDVTLADAALFPPPEHAEWGTRLTLEYRAAARRMRPPPLASEDELCRWRAWKQAHEDRSYFLWWIWDDVRLLHLARTDAERLGLLRRLRKWMGHELYAHGCLPPPVEWGWQDPPPEPESVPLPAR